MNTESTEIEKNTDGGRVASRTSDLLCIVKQICKKDYSENERYYEFYLERGDKVCANIGALTSQITAKANLQPWQTRYQLNKLLKNGLVYRKKTAGGISSWWPKGLAEELNA